MSQPEEEEKTSASQLVKDTSDAFHTYVGKGINVPGIGEGDTDLGLNVADLHSLLRIHFVITGTGDEFAGEQDSPRVVPFMKGLPDRLRRLSRSTYRESELVKGGVDGKIDWGETAEMYARKGYIDRTRFVCTRQQTEYDTPANQVLKRLLIELKSVFENELETAVVDPSAYEWLSEWLGEDGLLATLDRALDQNIYLESVRPPEKISQRVLTSVKRARQPLYRESAKLLEQYQRLQNRNLPPGEASDILRNVYIRPDTDNGGRLFELYWLFTLLDQYPDPELQLIQPGTNLVAKWTIDRQQYRLYHHSTGPPELDFTINSEEVAEELELLAQGSEQLGYFRRAHTVQRKTREISQQVLGREHRETLYSGVPDILLVRTDTTGELTGLLIGEVKYTRDPAYIKTGIEELLEYLYFVQYNGSYIVHPNQKPDADGNDDTPIEGVVFVDKAPNGTIETDSPVRVIEYGRSFTPFTTAKEKDPVHDVIEETLEDMLLSSDNDDPV